MQKICFATNNKNKLAEVRALLHGVVEIISLDEAGMHGELDEDFATLEENSLQKALFVSQKTGFSAFADDTGLEVDALHGAPGVFSARYAGPQRSSSDNIQLLLKNLKDEHHRKARFRTVIALVDSMNGTTFFEGKVEGHITTEPIGSGGFGYDPVFVPDGWRKTMAEMTLEEKNAISHRGKAVRKLITHLTHHA